MMKRREFLCQVAVASAGMLMPLPLLASPKASRKTVLIAGGGIAGLHTAELLLRKGYAVQVLESSSRLGGKLLGGLVGGQSFDFGAQAVGKDMLRVKRLARRFGLTMIPKPKQKDFFVHDKRVFTGSELEELHSDFDLLDEKAKAMFPRIDDPAQRAGLGAQSVMDWARPHLRPQVVEYYRTSFASEWCDIPEDVSLLHYLELMRAYDGEGEEMDFRFREGLYKIVEGLEKELKGCFELSCPLESVAVGKEGVTVKAGGRAFSGDYLVLAVPVTKLKKIPITGIDTAALAGALESFEGASVKKVIAVYEKPFWGSKARQGAFAPPCGMSIMDNSDLEKKVYSLAVFLGGPSVTESKSAVLARIASLLGPEALNPVDYHEQAWLGDEHLCGGYSANRRPARSSSYAAVPAHLGGKLFFAGSDVSDQFGSYVEGALASAERAAGGISSHSRLASVSDFCAKLS